MPQPTSFADRVVLITGAASGIGRTLARLLTAEGARVAGVDRAPDGLMQLASELPATQFAHAVADVNDRPALFAACADLERRLGPVDLLVASAGVGIETSALAFDPAVFEQVVAVNLVGVANSIAAVLPGMIERQRGHLSALSSLASYRGLPRMSAYCASKSGVNALLESMRLELQPYGIAVSIPCPGWIRTPMTDNIPVPKPDILEVEAAARVVLEALRRRRPFVAFPGRAARKLRMLRWMPPTWSDWLAGRAIRALQKSHPT